RPETLHYIIGRPRAIERLQITTFPGRPRSGRSGVQSSMVLRCCPGSRLAPRFRAAWPGHGSTCRAVFQPVEIEAFDIFQQLDESARAEFERRLALLLRAVARVAERALFVQVL